MKRSKFSLSNYKCFSGNMGYLIPCGLMEVLPGDTMQHVSASLIRVTPLLAPMLHTVRASIHHWYVPFRLIWEDWEDFITGGPDNDDASEFPTITTTEAAMGIGSLADYLGVPPIVDANAQGVSALPFRAYNLIYNEWYRDQDLNAERTIDFTSGVDTTTVITLARRCWEKDYFTTARPWAQKGPDITIGIGGSAPIVTTGGQIKVGRLDGTGGDVNLFMDAGQNVTGATNPANNSNLEFRDPIPLTADLSAVSGISINQLRESLALQRFAEARARFGSRYSEYLRYLGVRSPDARLQRPEYLGGGRNVLQISEVLQTGVTTDGDDSEGVGNLKGHGIGAMRSNRYRRFFEEHGLVLSIFSVQPKTMYVQGLARHWNRRVKEDFFQKELQHIGQQEVLAKEIFANQTNEDAVWGYQDRYDEYRRTENTVAGEMRTTLNYWHMARDFAAAPTLNSDFVTSNPTDRVFAVGESVADTMQVMISHSIQARRLLARRGSSFTY